MSVYLIGYTIVIIALSLKKTLIIVENKIPKHLLRIYIFFTFIAPPVALPFTKGPKIAIPTYVALTVGIFLLAMNFLIKILAQKQIGALPVVKQQAFTEL
jgi:hypothetical protein